MLVRMVVSIQGVGMFVWCIKLVPRPLTCLLMLRGWYSVMSSPVMSSHIRMP